MRKFIFLSVIICSLSACVNTERPPTSSYYVLEESALRYQWEDGNPELQLRINSLPSYLKQPNLVMLEDKHRLYFATYNKWATDLRDNIQHVLLHDLNSKHTKINFVKSCKHCEKIIISIDSFYPTSLGQVYLSGYFQLMADNNDMLVRQSFILNQSIQEDGFQSAVHTMRSSLSLLADEILNTLNSKAG